MIQTLSGNVVDVFNKTINPATITIEDGIITNITPNNHSYTEYIIPGFIDAHVHIESSLMVPSVFASVAVKHGTVATVSDPHEIANVLGVPGVNFMIEDGKRVPFHFFFGAPSCVPATIFETAGAAIHAAEVMQLLEKDEIVYLAEMMNYPGVIAKDEEVMRKIAAAQFFGKPVDGHAPGLRGDQMKAYFDAGITTDHECFTLEEALEKLEHGVKVIIREGSAARNFDALIPAIKNFSAQLMFCSDDKHPDSFEHGHINTLCKRAVALGYNIFDVLQVACVNPVTHYKLPVGLLRVGDAADLIVVDNLREFNVQQTFIKGERVYHHGVVSFVTDASSTPNQFHVKPIQASALAYQPKHVEQVIVCNDGQLITNRIELPESALTPSAGIHKLVVINRYTQSTAACAYIKGFGLTTGAIASSVAHDSHNIIAVGCDDVMLSKAINQVINHQGGLSAVDEQTALVLPLPVAGLMSNASADEVTEAYKKLDAFAKLTLGSRLQAPFMSLSFMALLVIPELKLSDKGLFDGIQFSFVNQA